MTESITRTSKFIAYLRERLKTEVQPPVTPQDLALIERFLAGAESAESERAKREVDTEYQSERAASLQFLPKAG
jgi:hypothetical protein